MSILRQLGVAVVLVIAVTVGVGAAVPVQSGEAHDWLLHVIPLPKEVVIDSKVVVAADEVVIVQGRKNPSQLERGAAQELVALFEDKAEVKPPLAQVVRSKAWNIVVGVADERGTVAGMKVRELERISAVLNAEQAYVIAPVGDNTLMLAATDPRGAYYAAKTLQHLLRPKFSGTGADATVEIPLARIIDWPDMAERGQVHGTSLRDMEYLAEYKMNLCEDGTHTSFSISKTGGAAKYDNSVIERGARYAVKVVPAIEHLDSRLTRYGFLGVFPEAVGVPNAATLRFVAAGRHDPNVRVACWSRPETVQVVQDWIVSLARQLPPQARDISVWLNESWFNCGCEKCEQKSVFVLQAEAIAQAYERAKQVRPDVKLRVELSQGSYPYNDRIIAALPPEIGFVYYSGGRTYTSDREPMIYPLLEEYARSGGWLGVCPQLTANFACVLPWSAPQFIKFRMQEFVDKGLQSLAGYTATDGRFYDFNVTASAEWLWNAHGRDEQEFALAYFTQKGLSHPEKRADWAVMLGPVGWDVYGADVPYDADWGIVKSLREEDKWPELGKGTFIYLPDEEHIRSNLGICTAAMKLAQKVGDRPMILETQVIQGYMKMLHLVYELGKTIGTDKDLSQQQKQIAAQLLGELHQATDQTVEGLRTWTETVAPDETHSRVKRTRDNTEQFMVAITEYLSARGVAEPDRP